jgi:hypothetical protein
MPDDLREQLLEAKRNLTRQLEVLQSPATVTGNVVPPDNRALITELQGQLREIKEAIANLDSDGA